MVPTFLDEIAEKLAKGITSKNYVISKEYLALFVKYSINETVNDAEILRSSQSINLSITFKTTKNRHYILIVNRDRVLFKKSNSDYLKCLDEEAIKRIDYSNHSRMQEDSLNALARLIKRMINHQKTKKLEKLWFQLF